MARPTPMLRQCTQCKALKQLCTQYIKKERKGPIHYDPVCRACTQANKAAAKLKKNPPKLLDPRKKKCEQCGEEKSHSLYYALSHSRGLQKVCKVCSNVNKIWKRKEKATPAVIKPKITTNPWENLGLNERPNWYDNSRYIPDAVPTHQFANIKI